MRALFITWAWGSHYYPMVPFGWALRAAGHEVLVASHPSFTPTITQAGLPALPVGPDIDLKARAATAFDAWRPNREGEAPPPPAEIERRARRWTALASESAVAMAEDTYRFAEQWRPDMVVYEPLAYLGPGLAGDLGIPALRLLWGTDYIASIVERQKDVFTSMAGQVGLEVARSFGDLTLDPCPPSLQVASTDVIRRPMRYIPYNGPAQLPATLRTPPSRPRVLVTWGGSLHDLGWHDGILAPRVVHALAHHDVDIIIATSHSQRHLYTDLPDNVIHLGPIALHLALPHCTAIIHQGGAGTTMTAMTNATPQLILPWAPDAIINAQQIQQTGAGHHLLPVDLDDTTLHHTINTFLTNLPTHQQAATHLHHQHLAQPTPTQVAAQLTDTQILNSLLRHRN